MQPKPQQAGFTLIELMIVVAIIGILAAVGLPSYQDYISTAQLTEAAPIARPYKEMVQEFYAHRGYLPRDNAELGIPEPSSIRGSHVASVHVDSGTVSARFSAAVQETTGTNEVVWQPCLVPDSPASPLTWGCNAVEDTGPYQPFGEVPADD